MTRARAFTIPRVSKDVPDDIDTIVVMLDGEMSFRTLPPLDDFDICRGAYLDLEQEILLAGCLVGTDCAGPYRGARNGWVMDIDLLRRKQKRGRRPSALSTDPEPCPAVDRRSRRISSYD
ncbi:MAG: hypothetical protein SGJ07_02380 [Rhodospirillaceae bacterium]|nr:hypothetical protein [Rhodospirillaceae bacterium]